MKRNTTTSKSEIAAPAVGCMVGAAYSKLTSRLAEALRKAGLDLSPNEYLVMRAVYSEPGLQQCDIADLTGKDKAGVCRCVATLEKRGLVRTDPVSHKCLRVFPTERGLELKDPILAVAAERHAALEALTTVAEFKTFVKVLSRIISES